MVQKYDLHSAFSVLTDESGPRGRRKKYGYHPAFGVLTRRVRAAWLGQAAGHLPAAWRPGKTSPGRDAVAKSWPSPSCLASRLVESGPTRSGQGLAICSLLDVLCRRVRTAPQGHSLVTSKLLGVSNRQVRAARPGQMARHLPAARCPDALSPGQDSAANGWSSPGCLAPW